MKFRFVGVFERWYGICLRIVLLWGKIVGLGRDYTFRNVNGKTGGWMGFVG